MQTITHNGVSAFNPGYTVYRDVKNPKYGSKGDGVTDDSDAINRAISNGSRCGNQTCQSSTLTPALIYFPNRVVLGTGLHWQVGQATNSINVHVEMSTTSGNKHQGIFIDSGGFMADLLPNGGAFGMWISNQKFTIHNVVITNADTAIYQLWNCLTTGGLTEATQSAGSIVLLDSKISATLAVVQTTTDQSTSLDGSIVLQNVDLSGSTVGVLNGAGHHLLNGGGTVSQFVLGNIYSGAETMGKYSTIAAPGEDLPPALLDASSSNNGIFSRTRPQYEKYAPTRVVILTPEHACPTAVLQVGEVGDTGGVEISDIVISTTAGLAGAIGVEVGDHDLDDNPGQGRINSFGARGIFIDHAIGPLWLVGTASEHHAFSIVGSNNVYAGIIQTETPYYQPVLEGSDLMADETSTIVPPRLSNGLMLSVTAIVPNTLTTYTSWNKWVMTAALQWGTGKTFGLEVTRCSTIAGWAALMELPSVVRDVELDRDHGKCRVDIRFSTRFCVFRASLHQPARKVDYNLCGWCALPNRLTHEDKHIRGNG
ncbi:hypothetical protein DFH08DRAFT_1075010 [Mycena albidolilacea]|uniref:Rhamnogalacturonase A/B/Epimerase-like pectate lyase domain-containing protein n=1 Tax=Mycena albidolilacea TaxID=1033008 RepID=A0AAD7EYR7_9AGAR|nr:hypothetical protein DFH08DRAFT_1075010 [Mycena albidolilacea]